MVGFTVLLCSCAPKEVDDRSALGRNPGVIRHEPKPLKQGHQPQPLNLNKRTHVVIQVDGGGIMGVVPARVLAELERQVVDEGETLKDITSMLAGTSTGSIISGMLLADVPAAEIAEDYGTAGVELFNSKGRNRFPIFPFARPMFDRATFQGWLYHAVEENSQHPATVTLGDLSGRDQPMLTIAAYDLVSARTLYLKNKDATGQPLGKNDSLAGMQLVDAISASALTAAVYFGKLPAPSHQWEKLDATGATHLHQGAVFQDGGQGTQNSLLGLTLLETIVRAWANPNVTDTQVVIISLGCGSNYGGKTYEKASELSGTGQALSFFNQARNESGILQLRAAQYYAKANPNVVLFRFDFIPPEGSSSFSAKLIDEYQRAADELIKKDDFQKLAEDLRILKKRGNIAGYDSLPKKAQEAIKSELGSSLQVN